MEQIVLHCLQVCEKLTELYLSHNSISVMEGLSTLQNLRVLDLASNRITVISNLENLTRCSLLS
jgi:protein phosphatase 1 regulatory subunit 7